MRIRKARTKAKKRVKNPKLRIRGLNITPNRIEKVDHDVDYSFADLDLLLTQHKEQIEVSLFDERHFDPNTLEVIEFQGEPFPITMN